MVSNETMAYEERLILFADILGWKAAGGDDSPQTLLKVIRELHSPAETHNEALRSQVRGGVGKLVHTEFGPMELLSVNPMWLDVQFGAFSDNLVFSMPSDFGSRIVGQLPKLIIYLLRKGFLIRGAITLGDLYHRDSVVFGPGLIEAVRHEKETALHARIILTDDALSKIDEIGYDRSEHIILKDQCGVSVVNPFSLPFTGSDDIVSNFITQAFHFREIKLQILEQVRRLRECGSYGEMAKWLYMKDFIEGPVLQTSKLLHDEWHRDEDTGC